MTALSPHDRARRGISIVFQGARIFRGMTVRGERDGRRHARTRHGFFEAALRLPRHRSEEREIRESADAALVRVGLSDWGGSSGGRVAARSATVDAGRARLCAEPALLLLDEPASGLRSSEREQLGRLLTGAASRRAHDDAGRARLSASSRVWWDRITVLDLGQVIAEGTPDEVRHDDRVVAAYLGKAAS